MSLISSNNAGLASLIRDEMIRRGYNRCVDMYGRETFTFSESILRIYLKHGLYNVDIFIKPVTSDSGPRGGSIIISSIAILDMFESYVRIGLSHGALDEYWNFGEKLFQASEAEFKKHKDMK